MSSSTMTTARPSFDPIRLEDFSEWARRGDIASTQIVKVEHWKYRSTFAFWHEFVLVKISGSSKDTPRPGSAPSDKLDAAFRALLRSGLVVRFDRRVPGDFAQFVTPDDETNIAYNCHRIQTVTSPIANEGSNEDSLKRGPYLGPCLRDIIFFLEMFTDNAPSYHLFSRNCYTFAWCTMGLLDDIFSADIETTPTKQHLWMSAQTQKLLRPGKLTGQVLNNEAYAMAGYIRHQLLALEATLAPPGEYAQQLIADSVDQNEDDDYHRRMRQRYRPEGGSKVTALADHPFRGYFRALERCDVKSLDDVYRLLRGFRVLSQRSEWLDNILCPGLHVQISRHLEKAFKDAVKTRDLSLILSVLYPFVDLVVVPRDLGNLRGEESKALCTQTTMLYEMFLQPSNLLPLMISYMKEPIGKTDWPTSDSEEVISVILCFLLVLAFNPKLRPVMVVECGLFGALLTLLTGQTHTHRTLEIALELVASFAFEYSNGSEFREFYDVVIGVIKRSDLPIMVQIPAVRSICHVARNPRSECIQPSLIPVLIEKLYLFRTDKFFTLKLTCALGLVLDTLRLFKEPLLRRLAYEHGQRHVIQAMRPQYRRQFQLSIVVSPLLPSGVDDDEQGNVTVVHELTNGDNLEILTKLLSAEHHILTRELVALVICNLTATPGIFRVLAGTEAAEKLSDLVNDPATTVTAHAKSTIEYTVSALAPYKRKTTKRGHEYETIEQIWSKLSSSWLNYLKPRLSDYGNALFIVKNRTLTDNTTEMVFSVIEFMNEILTNTVRDIAKDVDTLFGLKPSARTQVLFPCLPAFRERVEDLQRKVKVYDETDSHTGDKIVAEESTKQELETLESFLEFLEAEWEPRKQKLDQLRAQEMIEFDLIWALFKEGMKVRKARNSSGHISATLLTKCTQLEGKISTDWNEDYHDYHSDSDSGRGVGRSIGIPGPFRLNGETIQWVGQRYVRVKWEYHIKRFEGSRRIATLPILELTEDEESALKERGRRFVTYVNTRHVQLQGSLHTHTTIPTRCRVVIDDLPSPDSRRRRFRYDFAGSIAGSFARTVGEPVTEGDRGVDELAENELYLLPPSLPGFSLSLNKWGTMRVDELSLIQYSEHAWDHLVLDENMKNVIRSLVEVRGDLSKNAKISFDWIPGKSEGLVFLLHGDPGLGKTLTAETVAETLKRPLYAVSASELGIDPHEVEDGLQHVLNRASIWNAVLLIDEADVLLEKRSSNDLARNAMVAGALRLMEYHSGVLFLTTNRVHSFDPASLSRVSLTIRYDTLDRVGQIRIWRRFLLLAKAIPPTEETAEGVSSKYYLSNEDILRLAKHDLNGRVINNVVRTAHSLALSQEEPLEMKHLEFVIEITKKFIKDISELRPEDELVVARWVQKQYETSAYVPPPRPPILPHYRRRAGRQRR